MSASDQILANHWLKGGKLIIADDRLCKVGEVLRVSVMQEGDKLHSLVEHPYIVIRIATRAEYDIHLPNGIERSDAFNRCDYYYEVEPGD